MLSNITIEFSVMKYQRIIYVLVLLSWYLQLNAQSDLLSKQMSLDKQQWKVVDLLQELEQKGDFTIAYSPGSLLADSNVILSGTQLRVEQYLQEIFDLQRYQLLDRKNKIVVAPVNLEGLEKITISGYLREAETGESLIAATVQVNSLGDFQDPLTTGVVTNNYGFYSITLTPGTYELIYSYVGFELQRKVIQLTDNLTVDISLTRDPSMLNEVVVEANTEVEKVERKVKSVDLGKTEIGIQEIKQVPALLGEVDVVKAVQLLPGVKVIGEGGSNFFVRGGAADQNLILLDEAPIYNASHLMGFFSVFNSDAINNIQFYRGNIPAAYGGRLSSLLDIHMKEGNREKFGISGGIGLISSRLTVEGPLKKNKSSFIISGRRTYADLFFKFSNNELTRKSSLYFYDLNAKFNYQFNEKNKLFASGYFGRDLNKFRSLPYVIDWGNVTGSIRWNHLFNQRLFSNTTVIFSKYDYRINLSSNVSGQDWRSEIKDYALKSDFNYYPNHKNFVSFGFSSTYHQFQPGEHHATDEPGVPTSNALEHGLYISNEQQLGERISLEYGLRYSLFQLIGKAEVILYDKNYRPLGVQQFDSGEIYKTYQGLEPRISGRYLLGEHTSFKISYNRQKQYMQQISNLALGFNVFDIWLPSSLQTKPQTADIFSLGYFQNSKNQQFEFSAEAYLKRLTNQVDYKDHARLIMNRYLEGELRSGKGRAYGLELMVRRRRGRLTGWLSYTLSRVERSIKDINGGEYFPAPQDQPHSINAVGSYEINERWTVSANFVYATGRPVTLPEEIFRYGHYIVPVYGRRSSDRLPDYHRLDLSANLYPKEKPGSKNQSYWTFSVYNAYNRYNAATVFVTNELAGLDLVKGNGKPAFHKLSMFGLIPSVTYNFKF